MAKVKKVTKKSVTTRPKLAGETSGAAPKRKLTVRSNVGKPEAGAGVKVVESGKRVESDIPSPESSSSPAARVGDKKNIQSWMFLVLLLVVGLVSIESYVLLKGKTERQRELVELTTFGDRGHPELIESFVGTNQLKVDVLNRTFLVDGNLKRVVMWDANGKYAATFDADKTGQPNFDPQAADADQSGNVYIFDRTAREIYRFSPEAVLLNHWQVPSGAAFAVDKKGTILYLDMQNGKIIRYQSDGTETARYPLEGAKAELQNPLSMTTDAEGKIYVIDEGVKKIKAYSPEGRFLKSWKLKCAPEMSWLAVSGSEIYINSFSDSCILAYTLDGKPTGEIHDSMPSCFGIDAAGNIYLPKSGGITKFAQRKGAKE